MIYFTNLDKTPMIASEPEWQRELIKRINEEFEDEAIEASEKVKAAFMAKADELKPGYFATYFDKIISEMPRYHYIKNINVNGKKCEAEIDLILHTVSFMEI